LGASLSDGRIEEGIVTCPWHGWRYDAASGKGLPPRVPGHACALRGEARGDDVLVRIPEQEPVQEERDDDPSFWDAERWFRKSE
jgi:hypothetical protein